MPALAVAAVMALAIGCATGGKCKALDEPGTGNKPLQNGSFESREVLCGWRTVAMNVGQQPVLALDRNVHTDGRQSLRVSANDPADVAVVQDLHLPPRSLWRASCMVKTKNLESPGDVVSGTMHIRSTDNQPIVEGPSILGTSSWREVRLTFQVPPSGDALLVLFFAGFGKGTGIVWFDDVRLEEVQSVARPAISHGADSTAAPANVPMKALAVNRDMLPDIAGLSHGDLLDICEASLRWTFTNALYSDELVEQRFVAAMGATPEDLLARFRDDRVPVKPALVKTTPQKNPDFGAHGEEFPYERSSVHYYVDSIERGEDGDIVVECSVVYDIMAASGYTCHLRRRGGKWIVADGGMDWMS